MGEIIRIGDFGRIVFYVTRRHYFNDKEGKLRYDIIKETRDFEGMEITDADKTRIWVEGLDKENPEVFNIRRSNVVSFVRQERIVETLENKIA